MSGYRKEGCWIDVVDRNQAFMLIHQLAIMVESSMTAMEVEWLSDCGREDHEQRCVRDYVSLIIITLNAYHYHS